MPRSMTDENYVYKPWTQGRRIAASKAAKQRLAIIAGNREFQKKLGYVQFVAFNQGFEAGLQHAIRSLKMQKRRKP